MARGQRRRSHSGGSGRPRFLFRRRKYCKFCEQKAQWIDHKDVKTLQNYTPERGRILPRRSAGTCSKHQRLLMQHVERARMIAVLPFATD